jgi:cysteine synthase B
LNVAVKAFDDRVVTATETLTCPPEVPAPVAPPEFPAEAPLVALIGDTPLVDLSQLVPGDTRVYGKLEADNPGGSVKDRPARAMVEDAWDELAAGGTLVDATSGNTGIAYSVLGRALGFDVHLFMPENASDEREQLFELYGAEVTLTPADEGQDGAIERCQDHAEGREDLVYVDQYSNPANPRAHRETTGPEILAQAPDVTHFVTGIGTGGTITGSARHLRKQRPSIETVGLQPEGPLHGMEGWKHLATNKTPAILDRDVIDEEATIGTEDAWQASIELLRELGLALGPSAGANLAGARQLAAERSPEAVVTILPDGFDRYRSTLYGDRVREALQEDQP